LSFFVFAPLNYNHLVSFFKFIHASLEKKRAFVNLQPCK
jgi:hypothetical protein